MVRTTLTSFALRAGEVHTLLKLKGVPRDDSKKEAGDLRSKALAGRETSVIMCGGMKSHPALQLLSPQHF